MTVRRCSFETGDGRWLSLQWALRVLRDASFAVTVHGGCSRCGGGGSGTVGACLGVF